MNGGIVVGVADHDQGIGTLCHEQVPTRRRRDCSKKVAGYFLWTSTLFVVDFDGHKVLVASFFVPDLEEEVSRVLAAAAVEVVVGADKGRLADERRPRLACAPEAHKGLGW